MRTVGTVLKHAREEQGISVAEVSEKTKIKEKFLIALEEAYWTTLPNFSIASGFVKSYAQVVGVEPALVTALLRRDFPSGGYTSVSENQEMSISSRFVWRPRATLAVSVFATLLLVGGYLFRQYMLFVAPPPLSVQTEAKKDGFLVSGKTAPSATVEVNKHPVLLEKDGSFSITLDRGDMGEHVEIRAASRSGKETVVEKPTS